MQLIPIIFLNYIYIYCLVLVQPHTLIHSQLSPVLLHSFGVKKHIVVTCLAVLLFLFFHSTPNPRYFFFPIARPGIIFTGAFSLSL